MSRISSTAKVFCLGALILSPIGAAASVLERVLELASALYPQIRAANFSANIAENFGTLAVAQKTLGGGDRVIIGYDGLGAAVYAVAGPSGVLVTPAQTTTLISGGVSAGLYPLGSALYAIPPAGQLSIFNQTATGALLDQARTSYLTRIDGSITNIIGSIYPPEITQVAAIEAGARSFDFGGIASTALGAVNAGEIVTKVQVVTGTDAMGLSSFDLARLSKGPNIVFDYAATDVTSAMVNRVAQMGGGAEASMLAINLATNSTDVTGRVTNIVSGVNGAIVNIITTTLGAVNGGAISN